MIDYQILSAEEVGKRFRTNPYKTNIPFFDDDDLDRAFSSQKDRRGRYIVALEGNSPIAMIKYYHWTDQESHLKQYMSQLGFSFSGKYYQYSYVGTNPLYRRKGIGSKLNDILMSLLKPGDIVISSSHEEEGKELTNSWARKNKNTYNFMVGEWGEGVFRQYDPTKKNFWVADYQVKLAAKPISIDKNSAKQWVQKFVHQLPKVLKRFYPNPKDYENHLKYQRGFNSHTWEWNMGIWEGISVTEYPIEIPIIIKAKSLSPQFSHIRKYMAGGILSSAASHKKGRSYPISLTLYINEDVTMEGLLSHDPRFYKEAYSILIHEMTHALDYLRPETRKFDTKDYYNSPSEVRAFMQQIVDEVLEATEEKVRLTEGWGDFESSEFIWDIMYSSPTWNRIKRELSDKNKKLILKAVARSISVHIEEWLKPYSINKEATMRNQIKIHGEPYILSGYNGWGQENSRSIYLWVLDTDKKFLSMWVAKEGNEKYGESASTAERYLRVLERRKELNRVSHEEYLKIERAMNKQAEKVYRDLQLSIREQETQAERNFREVANLYFDRIIVQFFHEAYLKYKGTHPITFKYRPISRLSKERQLAYWVLSQVIERYWKEDQIFKYRERIWSPSNPLLLEGLGDQDPYFIMTDILPDKIDETLDRAKVASKVDLEALPPDPNEKDRKGNPLRVGDKVKLLKAGYRTFSRGTVALSERGFVWDENNRPAYRALAIADEDGRLWSLHNRYVEKIR